MNFETVMKLPFLVWEEHLKPKRKANTLVASLVKHMRTNLISALHHTLNKTT